MEEYPQFMLRRDLVGSIHGLQSDRRALYGLSLMGFHSPCPKPLRHRPDKED